MRANSPTRSASTPPTWRSQATGNGARNAGDPSAATTRGDRTPRQAATAEANRPSAMPTPTMTSAPAISPTAATTCSASGPSPPK